MELLIRPRVVRVVKDDTSESFEKSWQFFEASDFAEAVFGPDQSQDAPAMSHVAALPALDSTGHLADSAESQLDTLKSLIAQVNDNVFLAKLAIYSRERAYLKDMPAALTATVAARDMVLFHQVFDRVIDNGRVLRTLFQMIRSGQFGKKSLSSSLQRAFQWWLNTASPEELLSASIGHDPILRDVLRMARPTPSDNARRATFGWLTDKEQAKWAPDTEVDLPEQVRLLIAFRTAETWDGPKRAKRHLPPPVDFVRSCLATTEQFRSTLVLGQTRLPEMNEAAFEESDLKHLREWWKMNS